MAGPSDGPSAKTHQYTLSSFGNVAAGRTSEPGFAATSEAESADGRSASARGPSYKPSNYFSQVSSSLKYNKPKRQRVKVRSKLLMFCSCYRSWANLELCYSKWGAIPDSHERFLLKLAEDSAVAEDSKSLEGWTIQQMLSHASGDAFAGPNVVLQAIRDVRARHQQRSPLVVSARISNVTMWRKEVADWAKTSKDHILLVQETHLGPAEAREASNYMHRQGFQMYGGISHPTDKGTRGGVAVLVRSHIQGRAERSHLEEGCGFEAVDVRLQHTNLLVVSVYLKTGTSINTRPNSSILAELISLVRNWKGVWIIAGDFNTPPEEIAATNVLAEMNGCLCTVGVPTTDQGREIDFAIVHKTLEPLSLLRIDWSVPHKPHASLALKLELGEGLCPAVMLEQHSMHIEVAQAAQGDHNSMASPPTEGKPFQGEWLQDKLPQDEATQHFARVSEACSACVEPHIPLAEGQL